MKKYLLYSIYYGLWSLASCQNSERQIIGKWQVESYSTPDLDSFAQQQEKAIDTISSINSSLAASMETNNLDSIKAILKKRARNATRAFKQGQKEDALLTSYKFLTSNKVIFRTGTLADTNKWEIIGKNKLVFTRYSDVEHQDIKSDTLRIEQINSKELRLKSIQHHTIMYITLRPHTKADSLKTIRLIQHRRQVTEQQMLERGH